ncbi:hypothetical protein [Streptomyces clavuligerus]|uniref:hypothetical protein n=1 Tax=Streptomyces clavuligerus TaxID=1901 RepID=UPI00020D9358|nr:hypothetical protein [Streptomyces clavuligerus]ANW21236.1 hypothetical protein BB341_25020 [Streptomyces clavuligerus]AXU15862.1 hypothetical protein D1794_25995 [Streptomyces clavuligerus]MBY6305985.1 hypothetical protein [Streptomyces clavuligerus]QCS08644.1 hypothetical protein CRV15_25365 [Streptomyces clavuligerus]QPJ92022.1 hypothetical protein GE265_02775 [Streptomyces clavuligerus]
MFNRLKAAAVLVGALAAIAVGATVAGGGAVVEPAQVTASEISAAAVPAPRAGRPDPTWD